MRITSLRSGRRCHKGVLKLNVDEATFADEVVTRIEAVIKDWNGKLIVAIVKKFIGEAYALRTEILAVKEGLLLAQNLGVTALILEGDAKMVLESFDQSSSILSHNGIILSEAYGLTYKFSFFKA